MRLPRLLHSSRPFVPLVKKVGHAVRLALILILFAIAADASAKRSLLPPPDGYRGIEIDGVVYAVGMIYLDNFADTTSLKEFGFCAFEAVGRNAWHRQVKAIWPLDTDTRELPETVAGLTYEKVNSLSEFDLAYSFDKTYTPSNRNGVRGGFSRSYYSSYGGSSRYFSSSYRGGRSGGSNSALMFGSNEYNTASPSNLRMTPTAEMSRNNRLGPKRTRCANGACR